MENKATELNASLRRTIEQLANETDAARQSQLFRDYLRTSAAFWDYSWHNQMLIWRQKPDASFVGGFHTWLRCRRFVRKGEKGIAILAPMFFKDKRQTAEGAEAVAQRIWFKVVHVYDISQTDGTPAMIGIRQTWVHSVIQEGAKTLLSRSRVEVPQLALDVLGEWRKQTIYGRDNDYVFPSVKLSGKCPRSASMLVEDYIRPAAIRAGILIERDGKTYNKDGDLVKRFGFHNLGRHSLATFLMDEQENPAVVQAIMRHAKMDMTLYYSHSSKKAKRAAVENYAQRIASESVRVQLRVQQSQAVN